MRQKVFYIGKNSNFISHFVKILESDFEVYDSFIDFFKCKSQLSGNEILFFLFEKDSLKTDLIDISAIHQAFPQGNIILISDSLNSEEISAYLKSGIRNTISPGIDKDGLLEVLDYHLNLQQKIEAALTENYDSIKGFRLPLWKRVFDIVISVLALIILSPIFLIVAAAIRIESKGPVVYKSKRVGSNYKVFDFLKFRSMFMDADQRLKEFTKLNQYKQEESSVERKEMTDESLMIDDDQVLMVSDDFVLTEEDFIQIQRNKQNNAFIKFDKDPRITKTGRFIRKYSIDELPQLVNILKGDMSVVGNRPLPLYEAELLTNDEYIDRFMAPSGLTGLWQVEKRGGAGVMSAEERKNLDTKYAKKFSFMMDITIILKTFTAFIQKENV